MKVGPVHVVKDATMAWMQAALHRFSSCLADSNQEIERLCSLLAVTTEERDRLLALVADASVQSHRLQHHPAFATVAPTWISAPDAEDERSHTAAQRVVAAYRRAIADGALSDAGMWTHAERKNAAFIEALQDGDVPNVRDRLSRLFQSSLINGLGRFHESMAPQMLGQAPITPVQLQFSDALVSLAEAVGTARVTSFEQDPAAHARALEGNLDILLQRFESRTHLQLELPSVGAAYGCAVTGGRLAIDSFIHGYAIQQLQQLGAVSNWRFAEIGGGYGCLAALMLRHGFGCKTVYDLPWVNAIQRYFLIMAFPDRQIRLFAEGAGELEVLPFWRFFDLPEKSADVVINTDSLPEVGTCIARKYVETLPRVTNRFFFSINQEAKAQVESFEPQQCVAELIEESGKMSCRSRRRYWMRPGYVEEVFVPTTHDIVVQQT